MISICMSMHAKGSHDEELKPLSLEYSNYSNHVSRKFSTFRAFGGRPYPELLL